MHDEKVYPCLFFHLSNGAIMDVFTLSQTQSIREEPNHVMGFNKKQHLIDYSCGELPYTFAFSSSCLLLNH